MLIRLNDKNILTMYLCVQCAFDENQCLNKYDSVIQILKVFYKVRLDTYHKRKDYLEGVLQAEAAKLSNQGRFILEKCDGTLVIENKKKKDMIAELVRRNYESDPVVAWKLSQNREQVLVSSFIGILCAKQNHSNLLKFIYSATSGGSSKLLLEETIYKIFKAKCPEVFSRIQPFKIF